MSHYPPKKVALLLGQDLGYCRKVLSGILSYAEEKHLDWVYHDAPPDNQVLRLLKKWRPHGIIAHLYDAAFARRLLSLGIPLVSTTNTLAQIQISTVDVDNEKAGEIAALHFLALGHESFAYYGSQNAAFSRKRLLGYRRVLQTHGYAVSECHADFLPRSPLTGDWAEMERKTTRWLQQLPRPSAILASNDIPGRTLCHVCNLAGIQVPQEMAILGMDNDDSECRMSSPPLSSIDTPAHEIGRQAAKALNSLMTKKNHGIIKHFVLPVGVVSRESTDYRATMDPRLKKALNYIRDHSSRGLDVGAVCLFLGMSRRSTERLFAQKIHSTIHHQIQISQLERAKHLLLETDSSISLIAERSGFGSARQLGRAFRTHERRSPSELRHKNQSRLQKEL